jgi:hypothetical protein
MNKFQFLLCKISCKIYVLIEMLRIKQKLLNITNIYDEPVDTKICNQVCNKNLCYLVNLKNDDEYFGSGLVKQNRDIYKSNLR